MTNLSTVLERIAKAKATQTPKQTHEQQRKATQAKIDEMQATEQVEQELILGKFPVITNFFESLEGATRLYKYAKKMEEVNSGSYLIFQKADEDDFIAEIYATMLDYTPKEDEEVLPESRQKYYGIQTKEQQRAARQSFRRLFEKMVIKTATSKYDQDYGLNGTHSETDNQSTTREIDEKELEIILTEIFPKELKIQLDLKLQGYKVAEIAELTETPKRTVERRNVEIKRTLAIAFNVEV